MMRPKRDDFTNELIRRCDEMFFEIEGEEHCDEGELLAPLLLDETVFINQRKTEPIMIGGKSYGGALTTVIYVSCNDVFMWGCADAEPLPNDEIPALYRLWRDEQYGAVKWACRRRNQQPQPPLVALIQKAGEWDEEYASFEENPTARFIRERKESGASLTPRRNWRSQKESE